MELLESSMGRVDVKRQESKSSLSSRVCSSGFMATLLLFILTAQCSIEPSVAQTPAPRTPPAVGTIKSITGNVIVLTTQAGTDLKVQLSPEVKFLRVPPDSKDLKEAVAIELSNLQVGDRILARGRAGDDP